jgi:nucleosome binding factor SPN SPT16 subunit
MEQVYAAALLAQEAAIAALVDGAELTAPFEAAKAALISADPGGAGEELAAKLGKSIGTAIGLELREPSLTLGSKSKGAVQRQGLTLVHFSAKLERFVWDRGCA